MLRGKDKVIQYVQMNDCPYWVVFHHGSNRNHSIYKSPDTDSYGINAFLQYLDERLSLLDPGRYVIKCGEKPDMAKGYREIGFELEGQARVASASPAESQNQFHMGSVQEYVQKELDNYKRQVELEKKDDEIKRLKEEIKEHKANGIETAISGIVKRLDPYVDPMLDHFFPLPTKTQVGVAGLPEKNQPTTKKTNTMALPATYVAPVDDKEATERF